jgi:hypothetical protein
MEIFIWYRQGDKSPVGIITVPESMTIGELDRLRAEVATMTEGIRAAGAAEEEELLAACEEAERVLGNMGYTGDEGEADALYHRLGALLAKREPKT